MGIIDTIKGFFVKEVTEVSVKAAMQRMTGAARQDNYKQASVEALGVMEAIGEKYLQLKREPSHTVREFAMLMVEQGGVTMEEFEPIVHNFEIARYSEFEVSFDDYRNAEESLNKIIEKYNKGVHVRTAEGAPGRKRAPKRRKPKRRKAPRKRKPRPRKS